MPGHVNESWFKVPAGQEGVYRGQCAELCGPNHADMRASVRAVTPDEFQAGRRSKRDEIQAAGERSPSSASSARGPRGLVSAPRGAPGDRPARAAPAQRGWLGWLTTTDHKKIGILYLVATFVFFLLGGVEALIMRLQLAHAEQHAVEPGDLQRPGHDARDDDGLPVRRAGAGQASATTSSR